MSTFTAWAITIIVVRLFLFAFNRLFCKWKESRQYYPEIQKDWFMHEDNPFVGEYVLDCQRKRFRKHKKTHQWFVYHDQPFIDVNGTLCEKGWCALEERGKQNKKIRNTDI